MEWQQLEYFHTVAKLQHFTKAAEQLSLTQPALSRSIAQLEKELGIPLFDRIGRSITLNPFGQKFQEHTTRILNQMYDAKRDLQGMLNPEYGTISLGFLKSLGISYIPRLVRSYIDSYPHIQFQLYQNSTSTLMDQLLRGEIDFCISSLTQAPPEIEWRPLWTEEMYLFVHRDHPFAARASIPLRELADEKFIVLKQGYGSREIFDTLFQSMSKLPHIAFEGEEVVSVLGFVSENLGIALLPQLSGTNLESIVKLSIEDYPCERIIGLAWVKGKTILPAADLFRAFITSLHKVPSNAIP